MTLCNNKNSRADLQFLVLQYEVSLFSLSIMFSFQPYCASFQMTLTCNCSLSFHYETQRICVLSSITNDAQGAPVEHE